MTRILFALVAAVMLTPTAALADTRYVGIFMPVQNPHLDQITAGQHENDYFLPAWRAYQDGRVAGASANVRLFLLDGQTQTTIYRGRVDGYRYVTIDRTQVRASTQLCAEVPFRISHQTLAAGDRMVCTVQGDLNHYFRSGNGQRPGDAFGAIAIAPPSHK